MLGKVQSLQIMLAASIAAAAPAAFAGSNDYRSFALSLHDQLAQNTAQTGGFELTADVRTLDSEVQPGSVAVLFNPPAENPPHSGGIGGLSGADFADQRGSSMQGIDAREFFEPKSDGLTVAPLPPAAFAGMAMLAGFAGVRYFRKVNR